MYLNIWNLKDTKLIDPGIDIDDTSMVILEPDQFGDAPFILTLTRGLDYESLLESEHVLVTGKDPLDPTGATLFITRGYDSSIAKEWVASPSEPVLVYNIFTAAYYDILRDQVSYLDGRPVVLEMSNVDLDLASLLVHTISVSDGSSEGTPRGWNIGYVLDPTDEYKLNLVEIHTTSMLDQYSGRFRAFASENIRLDSQADINIAAGTGVTPTTGNINLITVSPFAVNLNVDDTETPTLGAQIGIDTIDLYSPTTFKDPNRPLFEDGLVIANKEPAVPTDGTIKFLGTGDPGFYGYYNGDWNKLGFTAEIIIGQETFIYCFVDAILEPDEKFHIGDTVIKVKNLSSGASIGHDDTALINGVPYAVDSYDDIAKEITLQYGLIEDVPNNTPILITKQLSDAMDGFTLRFSGVDHRWVATDSFQIPHDQAESIFTYGRDFHIKKHPTYNTGGSLTVDKAITIGSSTGTGTVGTIKFKNNNFYGTVNVSDGHGGFTPVEISIIPDVAYEFLSEINIPDEPASDGHVIRYDYAAHQWIHTADIRITTTGISMNKAVYFNEPVTFNSTVSLDLGLSFTTRIAFLGGIKFGVSTGLGVEEGCIDYIDTYKYDNPYGTSSNTYGALRIRIDTPLGIQTRILNPIPYLEDFNVPSGQHSRYIIPISAEHSSGGQYLPYWSLKQINVVDTNTGGLRFPARMKAEALGDDALHVHGISDINFAGFPWAHEFGNIILPDPDEAHEPGPGEYVLRVVQGDTNTFQLRYRRTNAPIVDMNCIYIQPSIVDDETVDINTYVHGNLFVKKMYLSERAGRLEVESTIRVGMNTSAGQTGMIRYMPQDPGSTDGPGDLQGYITALIDPETNSTISGWVSLTSGLPQPLDQDWGGLLYYNGDVQQYSDCTVIGNYAVGEYELLVHTGVMWPPKSGDVAVFKGFSYTVIDATEDEEDPGHGTLKISPKLRDTLTDGDAGQVYARPEWTYTDKIKFRNGVFIIDAPITLHSDLVMEDIWADYIDAGPIKVGDATWLDDFPDRVKPGTLRYTDSLWVYADSMWKDLLSNNAITLPNIPIEPTEDGVILRYDLDNEVWEATGLIKVPTTNNLVDIGTNVDIAGSLTVGGNTTIHGGILCDQSAYFRTYIQIGTPVFDNMEGRIRFNGDFEGYIPNIGWVSFTRRFDESTIGRATLAGHFLESFPAGDHYNWAQSQLLYWTNPDILTVVGGLQVSTDVSFGADLSVTGSGQIGKGLAVVGDNATFCLYQAKILVDADVGDHIIYAYLASRKPDDNLFAIQIGTEVYNIVHYDSGAQSLELTQALLQEVHVDEVYYYGYSTSVLKATTGALGANFAAISTSRLQNTEIDAAKINSLCIENYSVGVAAPGAIKFEDNRFQGYLEGIGWQEFGPIDIREYFDLPETNESRRYGDFLIYDGLGRWMETPLINIQARWLELVVPNIQFKNWSINTKDPYTENNPFDWNFTIKYNEAYQQQPINMLDLSPYGSTLSSDFRVEGTLDILAETRLYGKLTLAGENLFDAFAIYGNGVIYGDVSGVEEISANSGTFMSTLTVTGSTAQLLIGDINSRPTYPAQSGYNWMQKALYLDGDLSVTGNIYNVVDFDLEGRITLGDPEDWEASRGDEDPIIVTRSVTIEPEGNIFVRKSAYFGHYVVPSKPDDIDYYAPKGAIRYTAEGPLDRGDWEGWDGNQWRSFTNILADTYYSTAYQTLYFDPDVHVWRGTDAMLADESSIRIDGVLMIVGNNITPNYSAAIEHRYNYESQSCSVTRLYTIPYFDANTVTVPYDLGSTIKTAYNNLSYASSSNYANKYLYLSGASDTYVGASNLASSAVPYQYTLVRDAKIDDTEIYIVPAPWERFSAVPVANKTIITCDSGPNLIALVTVISGQPSYYKVRLSDALTTDLAIGTTLASVHTVKLHADALLGSTTIDVDDLTGTFSILYAGDVVVLPKIAGQQVVAFKSVQDLTTFYRCTLYSPVEEDCDSGTVLTYYPKTGITQPNVYVKASTIDLTVLDKTINRGRLELTRNIDVEYRKNSGASLNIEPDDLPETLVNGDIWLVDDAAFIRLDGTTYEFAGSGVSSSWTREEIASQWWLKPSNANDNVSILGGVLTLANLSTTVFTERVSLGTFTSSQNGVVNLHVGATTATTGDSHAYGLVIDNVTKSGTGTAYAIKTGFGYNYFGDDLTAIGVIRAGKRFVADALSTTGTNFGVSIEQHIATDAFTSGGIHIDALTNPNAGSNTLFGLDIRAISSASTIGDTYGIFIWGVTNNASGANRDAYGLRILDVTPAGTGDGYAINTAKGQIYFGGETTTKLYKFGIGALVLNTTGSTVVDIGNVASDNNSINIAAITIGTVQGKDTSTNYGVKIGNVYRAGATGQVNYAINTGAGRIFFGNGGIIPIAAPYKVQIDDMTYSYNTAASLVIGNVAGSGADAGVTGIRVGTVTSTGAGIGYGIQIGNVSGGTTNYALYTGTGLVSFGGIVNTTESYQVDGVQVITNRQAAITNANTAHTVNNFSQTNTALDALGTKINAILSMLRTHGLITP